MDTLNAVPYVPDLAGEPIATRYVRVEFDNREIQVGFQPEHPQGPGYVHYIYKKQPDGTVTELRFFLTEEAIDAMILCYKTHGLIPLEPEDIPWPYPEPV